MRAKNDPEHCARLHAFRKLPTTYPTGEKWGRADKAYRPMSDDLCAAVTEEITASDIQNDPEWNTKSTCLTSTNSDRMTVNKVRVMQFARANNQPTIGWRRELKHELPQFLQKPLYNPQLFPELFAYFTQSAPAMVLANGHANVSRGIANGSSCKMVSLSWDDDDDRRAAEAIISAHRDYSTVCEIPKAPDHIIVSIVGVDVAKWPKHLNLAPQDSKGVVKELHIPIGVNTRQTGVLTMNKLKLPYRKHAVDLAFAITVHKAQGKTLSHVLALLDGENARLTFELLYVSFSRVTCKENFRCFPLSDRRATIAKLKSMRPRINAVRYRLDSASGKWRAGTGIIRPTKRKPVANRA